MKERFLSKDYQDGPCLEEEEMEKLAVDKSFST